MPSRSSLKYAVAAASLVVVLLSISLCYWDFLVFSHLESSRTRSEAVRQVWRVWSQVTISVIWFAVPVYALLRRCCRFRAILWTCVTVLLASGPNLFLLSLMGCASNAIKPTDVCVFSWMCSNAVSALIPLFLWGLFFLTALISTWAFVCLLLTPRPISSHTLNLTRWTNIRLNFSHQILLELNSEELCSICLGKFTSGENMQVLNECRHKFHSECLEGWVGYGRNCPVCRRVLE